MARKRKKLHKKELTEKDQVLTTLEKGWALLEKHAYKVAAFMVGALVVSGAWALWGHLSYESRTDACRAFVKALKVYNAPVGAADLSGKKGAKSFATEQGRAKAALKAFQKVIDEHASHGLSRAAWFYKGDCLYQLGRYRDALKAFDKYLSGGSSGCGCGSSVEMNEAVEAMALENKGYCYEALKDYKKALEMFQAMEKVAKGFRKDWAVYHQARMYEALGQVDKAIATYRQVTKADKKAVTSPLAPFVANRVTYLEMGRKLAGRPGTSTGPRSALGAEAQPRKGASSAARPARASETPRTARPARAPGPPRAGRPGGKGQ